MAEPVNPAAPDAVMEVNDTSIEEIESQGDILFLVGPKEKQVRVHSLTMARTSPVFAKMVGPNFSEGQSLANRGIEPVAIKLPEDDPCAFVFICSAVHGISLDTMPDSKQLLDVAILADKYDFIKALRYASQYWIQKFSDYKKSDDLWRVLVSAYMLGDARGFQRISRQLVLWHEGSCWDLMEKTPRSELTALLACKLGTLIHSFLLLTLEHNAVAQDKVKNEIENEVIKMITHQHIDRYYEDCNFCQYHVYQFGSLLKEYEHMAFWQDIGKASLSYQLQGLRRVNPENDNPVKGKCRPKIIEMNEEIQAQLTELFDGITGLCLESFKDGKIVGWTELY